MFRRLRLEGHIFQIGNHLQLRDTAALESVRTSHIEGGHGCNVPLDQLLQSRVSSPSWIQILSQASPL